jgi:hypothetical protein
MTEPSISDQSLARLLPAIDIAAFERTPGGSFTPVAPAPQWFRRLADVTFPFLGHILDEANHFWAAGAPGSREWGPCAEVDDTGVEFHYKVTAVTAPDKQYLLFQRDRAADRMREMLQGIRDERLAIEQGRGPVALASEAQRTAAEIHDAVTEQLKASYRRPQDEFLAAIARQSADLVALLDELARGIHGFPTASDTKA